MTEKQIERFRNILKKTNVSIKRFCIINKLDYTMFIQRLNGFKPMNDKTEKAINKFMGK